MSTQLRILITGSRDWTDESAIAYAIVKAIAEYAPHLIIFATFWAPWDQITIVHGAARGADTLAACIAKTVGMRVEAHPADWEIHGRRAGPIRNQRMVDLGADVCLAFPLGQSRGTRDCMARAAAAGIPVIDAAAAKLGAV